MVNTTYLFSFVETPRKFIIAIINLRGVSTKLKKYIALLSPLNLYLLFKRSGSFGDSLDYSVQRKVFMFIIMHFHDHSKCSSFFLGGREGILIILLVEVIIPKV